MDIKIFDDKINNSATVDIIADSPVMDALIGDVLSPIFKRTEKDAALTIICCDESPKKVSGRCIYIGSAPSELSEDQLFLSRPLDIEALYLACLEIRRSLTVSRGSWTYDPSRMAAFFGSSEIILTPKEGELFALLLSSLGECVPREQMEDLLWDGRSDSNCADVYICYLRKKLEKIAGPGVLISVRGQGYMLK